MESFKTFFEHQEFVDQVINEFDQPMPQQQQQKVWSAKKPEILQMWQNLRPDMPINITPIVKKEGGGNQSYGEDGIRITGSWPFIASILGRLKEVLAYESNQQTKLRLVFRGVDKARSGPDKNSFVFYMNVDERGQGRSGRPKKLEVPTI
jgi:hypothetical protein